MDQGGAEGRGEDRFIESGGGKRRTRGGRDKYREGDIDQEGSDKLKKVVAMVRADFGEGRL